MKIFCFLGLFLSTVAYASPCKVDYPDQFSHQFQKLESGECLTDNEEWLNLAHPYFGDPSQVSVLYFDQTMEIDLRAPLLLQGRGEPILIVAKEGAEVQIHGWPSGPKTAGWTLQGSNLLIKNLKWTGFLGSAIRVEGGRNIVILKSEVTGSGVDGIDIHRAQRVFLKKLHIHHNKNFGISADGEEIQILHTTIDHNLAAGLFAQKSFLLSHVSFYGNGAGVLTEGSVLPAPQGLVATKNGNAMDVTGFIPLSIDPDDPWRLGIVHPREMAVELYWSDPQDPTQGKTYITTVDQISDQGTFQASISLPPTEQSALTAIVIDRVLHVSSGFSSGGDQDHDGIDDDRENNSDPRNADSDLDGLTDGEEMAEGLDPNNPDTDGDCLADGLEKGVTKETLLALRHASTSPHKFLKPSPECIAQVKGPNNMLPENGLWSDGVEEKTWDNLIGLYDSDPTIVSNPAKADSDGDRVADGQEDKNLNGRLDEGESNPSAKDSDEDGADDQEESELGTNLTNPDTDGDGAEDGFEVKHLLTDPLNCDTDHDGLGDGLEGAIVYPQADSPECRGLSTSPSNFAQVEVLDPLNPDSDRDGLKDGEEDKNQNGWVDANETDPTLVEAKEESPPTPSVPAAPSLGNGGGGVATPEKTAEEPLPLLSEVVPARGGGACQLVKTTGERSSSPFVICALSFVIIILRFLLAGGGQSSINRNRD